MGDYEAPFTITHPGKNVTDILFNGTAIPGSPFYSVTTAAIDLTKSHAYGIFFYIENFFLTLKKKDLDWKKSLKMWKLISLYKL